MGFLWNRDWAFQEENGQGGDYLQGLLGTKLTICKAVCTLNHNFNCMLMSANFLQK
jgi:putative flippase GtrA